MVEKVVGGGDVVKEVSNRFRVEKVGSHQLRFPLPWWEGTRGRGIKLNLSTSPSHFSIEGGGNVEKS
jgi:hypothetical protein